jgi:hypothetical protein
MNSRDQSWSRGGGELGCRPQEGKLISFLPITPLTSYNIDTVLRLVHLQRILGAMPSLPPDSVHFVC